jgi:hypothetical protein
LKLPKDIGVAQLVTVPTSKFKALSPNPTTERGRGRERERKRERERDTETLQRNQGRRSGKQLLHPQFTMDPGSEV